MILCQNEEYDALIPIFVNVDILHYKHLDHEAVSIYMASSSFIYLQIKKKGQNEILKNEERIKSNKQKMWTDNKMQTKMARYIRNKQIQSTQYTRINR